MAKARLITPITLGARQSFPCVLCQDLTNIGFVDQSPQTHPAWLLYPVCFRDADLVQHLYAASDQPLHVIMAGRMTRSGEQP